jgi:hypothetical protein
MSLLSDLVSYGCSMEFAMMASKHVDLYDGDMDEFIKLVQEIEMDGETEDTFVNSDSNDQGKGVMASERDYEGDLLNYFGYKHS